MKRLIHSVTKDDFEIQTFCAGGKGGQHQNRKKTAVRIIHRDSGARGECREERHQAANKARAFKRCIESQEFKSWHKMAVAKSFGKVETEQEIRERVDRELDLAIKDGRVKIEFLGL